MTLLQIQEPASHPATRPSKLAVGIDLGTTNSLVAAINDSGVPAALGDSAGRKIMPSAVHYAANGAVTVGVAALSRRQADPQNVICSVKRLMGRNAAEVSDFYHYDYVAKTDGMAQLHTAAGNKTPVEISAEILRELRQRAEQSCGRPVEGAVITVPAYFDETQRQATKDAARLAGLPVYRLLSEPTAAAVAYGLDNAEEGDYVIYDLGGGTFDVSLLRLQKGVFTVLATSGDTALGGDDYDRMLAQAAAVKLNRKDLSATDRAHLYAAACTAKETLSAAPAATLRAALSSGEVACEISGEEFAAATAALTAATIDCCRAVLADAGISANAIKDVVLVGGATRMPMIQSAVTDFFERPPITRLNPDEVVSLGAAAQADLLAGNRRGNNWLLLDVIPLSLGLETMGGLAEKIILRNTAIPIVKTQTFTTHQDGQTAMSIHVVQGERELVRDCRSLAQFTLSGIPPLAAGLARVQVSFQVDADGLLSVTATEQSTDKQTQVAVKPTYGLDEAQIADMLHTAFANAQEDAADRQWRESRQDGETLLAAIAKALDEAGHLLAAAETATIAAAAAQLKKALTQEDRDAVEAAIKTLNTASADFAARRMNADIKKALAGKKANHLL